MYGPTFTTVVCTVKNSWWLTEELSETCRILFQNWIWEISASSWFYYMKLSRCTVTCTSNWFMWVTVALFSRKYRQQSVKHCVYVTVTCVRIWQLSASYLIIFNRHKTGTVRTGLFKMIFRILKTCHTQYTWYSSICIFLFNRTTLQGLVTFLTGTLCVNLCDSTGLFEMIFGVLTTCHTQYTWDSSICVLLFNRTTLPSFCYIPYRCSICASFVILQGYSIWL